MSELAQKIGQSNSVKNKEVNSQVNTKNAGTASRENISPEKKIVRDITREQWFWDTAVLS